MFDKHIRNLEQIIHNYQASIEDDDLEPKGYVGINEQRTLELIQTNNRITAKEVAESLSVSLRQDVRVMATLKEKGLIMRVGSNKSGHWVVIE